MQATIDFDKKRSLWKRIKEKGTRISFQNLSRKIRGRFRPMLQTVSRLMGDYWGFLRWLNQSRKAFSTSIDPRRLLMIYDLRNQPFSIGDILVIQEASLVLREQHQLGMVDFALLYDQEQPHCNDVAFSKITSENVLFHLASILPVAQVNQYHGSLFLFNSEQQIMRYIARNTDQYFIWPSAWNHCKGKYHYYEIFNNLFHQYYIKHNSIPSLSCRQFMIDWADHFYHQHVFPGIPITVQVRKNEQIQSQRNLQLENWLEFFRYCQNRYPVKFVIVCALKEVDARMRQLPNVIIAKDHGTTIEQDLALIQMAAIHMGSSSGPGELAVFNSKPYLLVNSNTHLVGHNNMIEENGLWRFPFSTPYQHHAPPPDTLELLIRQFEWMWSAVKRSERNGDTPHNPGLATEIACWLR
jgi:hypothetical protein